MKLTPQDPSAQQKALKNIKKASPKAAEVKSSVKNEQVSWVSQTKEAPSQDVQKATDKTLDSQAKAMANYNKAALENKKATTSKNGRKDDSWLDDPKHDPRVYGGPNPDHPAFKVDLADYINPDALRRAALMPSLAQRQELLRSAAGNSLRDDNGLSEADVDRLASHTQLGQVRDDLRNLVNAHHLTPLEAVNLESIFLCGSGYTPSGDTPAERFETVVNIYMDFGRMAPSLRDQFLEAPDNDRRNSILEMNREGTFTDAEYRELGTWGTF